VGSNPTLSAIAFKAKGKSKKAKVLAPLFTFYLFTFSLFSRRGARVVELAALEML
jgi:hypothetical protein